MTWEKSDDATYDKTDGATYEIFKPWFMYAHDLCMR